MDIEKERALYQAHTRKSEHYLHTKVSIEYTIEVLKPLLAQTIYEIDAAPIRNEIARLDALLFSWDFPDKIKS